jgi:hypothetical protein
MSEDPIVAEVHQIRQQIMAKFNGDLEAYVAYLQTRWEDDRLRGFREASLPRVTPHVRKPDAA